jgi:hypothetical protein
VCTDDPLRKGTQSDRRPIPGGRRLAIVEAILWPVCLYSFAGWAYIAAVALVHPESLGWPLTHLAPWPREDTFGIFCFAVSFASATWLSVLRAAR